MDKKAQGEIITTVLIILLVLAAIVIVWQVVSTSVKSSAEQIPGQTDCLVTKIDIVEAKAGTLGTLKLKRGTGEGSLAGVKVYVDDSFSENVDFTTAGDELDELETQTYTLTNALISGKNVKIAKLIGNNVANARLCEFMDNSATGGVTSIA